MASRFLSYMELSLSVIPSKEGGKLATDDSKPQEQSTKVILDPTK